MKQAKQIKTVIYNIDYARDFDEDVNDALADGWTLTRREMRTPRIPDRKTLLYAELEKEAGDESDGEEQKA